MCVAFSQLANIFLKPIDPPLKTEVMPCTRQRAVWDATNIAPSRFLETEEAEDMSDGYG